MGKIPDIRASEDTMKCMLLALLMASTAQAASLKKIAKPFVKLSALTVLSAEFDAATTYRAMNSGGVYEANPMVRPFAHNATIFPVLGASAMGVNLLASWMEKNDHRKLGRTLQIICIGSHAMAGISNLRSRNPYQH
jgi:Domain of unknown function (DUF5658)